MLGIFFLLGIYTGWRLTGQSREGNLPPSTYKKEIPPSIPSTPILIIPHRTAPSTPPPTTTPQISKKPKITKPLNQPEISITPSNAPTPPTTVTTPPPQTAQPPQTNLTKETAPQPSPKEQKLYKVTIGPLSEDEAKKMQEKLSKEGKQAFLVPADGKFKLQLGAFLQRENAQQLVEQLKGEGYNPTIEEK